jgi:hypothetical protein
MTVENANGRRRVIVVRTEEHEVVTEAITALQEVANLFERDGKLVRVRWSEPPPLSTARRTAYIEVIPSAALRELLSQHARFVSGGESNKQTDRHLPPWLVPQLEARGTWPGIRKLMSVIHEPCLRPDGVVLDEPGHDAATGLLYLPLGGAIKVESLPTREDARYAVESLFELLCDFPFVDKLHRSACLAAMLTPFTRFAFREPAPLFMIDANTAGTGKSTLADVISIVAAGQPMARNAYPQSDDEMRKLITSIARDGTRLTLFDNISGALGCPSFDAALTGTSWRDRLLGKNVVTAPMTLLTIWYATGNNIMLNADTYRRTLQIRLETQCERPEERRGFAHPNLLRWVENKRDSFVRDALTILRAYHVAGCPTVEMEPWGSFDEWSKQIRAPLIWCGLPDPASTRRELATTSDHERDLVSRALVALAELDPHGAGMTANETIESLRLPTNQPQRATLVEWVGRSDRDGLPPARSLGNKLRGIRGRVVDGRLIVRNGERWRVRTAATEGTGASTGSRSGRSPGSPDQEDP